MYLDVCRKGSSIPTLFAEVTHADLYSGDASTRLITVVEDTGTGELKLLDMVVEEFISLASQGY